MANIGTKELNTYFVNMAKSGHDQSSFSDELYNLSFDSVEDDSNNVAWFSLIQNLSYDKLESLRAIFKEKSGSNDEEFGLNREEFLNTICYLYGNSKYSLQSILLFDGVTKGAKSTVTWNDFLDFLIESICPKVDQKVLLSIDKIESIPHTKCLAYKRHDNFNEESNESILFMGDCYGEVMSFKFLQPKQGFLRKKHNDKMSLFYWIELPDEKEYVVIKSHGRIHKNSIKQIKYCPKNNSVFTCSRDSEASVVQRHVLNKRKPYIFKMKRGASCFTICNTLKLLITGSDDGTIRIWNSVMVSKPIAVLLGHQNDIADMQIMENQQILLSCSRDGVFKSWDIVEHKCHQSFRIKFPSFGIEGKCIEWGTNSIFAGPKRYANADMLITDHNTKTCFNIENISERKERKDEEARSLNLDSWERSNILVTCCNYIASIRLRFDDVNVEKTFEMQVLPPPPLQSSVLIPSSWRIQNKLINKTGNEKEEERKIEDYDIEVKNMEELSFILDKNLLEEDFMKSDINKKITVLEAKKLEMQKHVAIGAPYLVLDLFDITELKLSENLPIPNKRSIKSIVEKTEKILVDASTKDQVFSEPSSSRSKSSRSSLIEFPY